MQGVSPDDPPSYAPARQSSQGQTGFLGCTRGSPRCYDGQPVVAVTLEAETDKLLSILSVVSRCPEPIE